MHNFSDCCFDILQATDIHALRTSTGNAADALGFEHITSFFAFDRPGRPTDFVWTAYRIPSGYEEIHADRSLGRACPVSQTLKRSHTPVVWDQDFYERHAQGAIWHLVSPYGYKAGISSALHMPHGRHHSFGVARPEPLPSNPMERNELIAKVTLLGCYVHEAASRIFSPLPLHEPQLSAKEQECLRWALDGKTAWETGRILHLSERTVSSLLGRAAEKLKCSNKYQAALRAWQLGMIVV